MARYPLSPYPGRPAGARNRLSSAFLNDLLSEWNAHGRAAIETVRKRDPATFVKIVASTLPREFSIEHSSSDLSAEERDALIEQLKQHLLAVRAENAQPVLTSETPKLIEAQPDKVTNGKDQD
jgi:hypothetical protein